MKLNVNFRDDRPVSAADWERAYPPARHWRHNPERPTRAELLKVVLAGILAVIPFFVALVLGLCY